MSDVTITLNENEQRSLNALFDLAIGAAPPGSRMQIALAAAAFLHKIELAQKEKNGRT